MKDPNNHPTTIGKPSSLDAQPFTALFRSLPPNRVRAGTLEVGDWFVGENECELPVELLLGPDGQVWAQVGAVEDLPLRALETRTRHARRILEEFLEAYAEWTTQQAEDHPTAETLPAEPPWRLTSWLSKTAPETPGPMGALMSGVLAELEALGFCAQPALLEEEHP